MVQRIIIRYMYMYIVMSKISSGTLAIMVWNFMSQYKMFWPNQQLWYFSHIFQGKHNCPMSNGKHNITSCKARSVRYYTNYTTTVGAQAFVSMHASTGVWSDVVDTLGVSIAIITQIVAFIEVYEK